MADQVGVATQPTVPEGLQMMNTLTEKSGTPALALQYKERATALLQHENWGQSRIDEYFGDDRVPDAGVQGEVSRGVDRNMPQVAAKVAQNPWEAAAAGWQNSNVGMGLRAKLPDVSLGTHASIVNQLVGGAAQMAGDLPTMVAGGVSGASAGAAVPVADLTGVPEVVGGGFGAFAAPTAMRHALTIAIQNGNGKYQNDPHALFVDAGHATIDTLKQGALGAVSSVIGGKVGAKVAEIGGETVLAKLAGGATNVATQANVAATGGALMEGRIPTANDYIVSTALALGSAGAMHVHGQINLTETGKRVQSNLQEVYKETGIPPWQAVKLAKTNPAIQQELMAQDVNGMPVTPHLKTLAPPEPPRYGDPQTNTAAWGQQHATIQGAGLDRMKQITGTLETGGIDSAKRDSAVSPAGAIGRYQIMPGTARQYGFDPKDMLDPAKNEAAHTAIMSDLLHKANGDEAAALVGYNAGPGRMAKFINAEPGTRLEAIADKTAPGGTRYNRIPAERDESFLPMETQKYVAKGRLIAEGLKGSPGGRQQVEGAEPKPGEEQTTAGLQGSPEWETERQGLLDKARAAENDKADEEQKAWDQAAKDAGAEGEEPPPAAGKPQDWLDKIGEQVADPRPQGEGLLNPDRLYRQWLDDRGPAKAVDASLTQYGFDPRKDLGLTDMLTYARAANGRAAAMMKWGAFDPQTGQPIGGPSMQSAFETAKKDSGDRSYQNWERYMLAKRAIPREEQGIKTGLSMPEAKAIDQSPELEKKYGPATSQLNYFMHNTVLGYAKERGLYSPEQVEAITAADPIYISMQRAVENPRAVGAAKGFTAQQLAKMKGSDKLLASPLESTMWDAARTIANADRNHAIGYLVDLAEKGMLPEELGVKKVGEAEASADPKDLTDPEAQSADYRVEKNQFAFFRDGVKEVWETKDPEFATMLKGVASRSEAELLDRTMTTFARIARSGISGAIDFPLRVIGFHQLQNFVTSPDHPLPYLTWGRGMFDAMKITDNYKTAMFNGALNSSAADFNIDTLHDNMAKVFQDTGVSSRLMNAVPDAIHLSAIIHARLDAAARIGNIKVLESKGIGPVKASLRSKSELLDFTQHGTSEVVNMMARWTPFLQGRMLGTENWVGAVGKRPLSTSIALGMGVMAPAILLGVLAQWQDKTLPPERRLDQYDPRLRDTHFITPEIGGQRFMMPLMPVLGNLVAGPVWRTLDKMQGDDPESYGKWAERMLGDFLDVVPPAIRPVVEQATNHSFFTGKPLVPSSMHGVSPYLQHTESTTKPAIALSKLLGDNTPLHMSPIVMENYAQAWSGPLGMMALHAVNAPFKDPGPPSELGDIPFVKAFAPLHPRENAYSIQNFYDKEQQFAQAHNDYALATKRLSAGEPGAIDDLRTAAKNPEAFVSLAYVSNQIRVQHMLLLGVYKDTTMNRDEKMQRISSIYQSMIQASQNGLHLMKTMNDNTANRAPVDDQSEAQ